MSLVATLERVAATERQGRADDWARYAELIHSAHAGGAPDGAELSRLMRSLGLSTEDVVRHGQIVEEARAAAELSPKVEAMKEAAAAAQGEWAATVERVKVKMRELEDEERAASAARSRAWDAHTDAVEARAKLGRLQLTSGWLVPVELSDGGDAEIATRPIPGGPIRAVADQRFFDSLRRTAIYTAETLGRTFGITDEMLRSVSRLPSGEYYGANLLQWSRFHRATLRQHRRAELSEQLVPVDDRLRELQPRQNYGGEELGRLGFPRRFPFGFAWTTNDPGTGFGHVGEDVIRWTHRADQHNQTIQNELDNLRVVELADIAAMRQQRPPAESTAVITTDTPAAVATSEVETPALARPSRGRRSS